MVPVPEDFITKVEKITYNFIRGKRDRIRRLYMIWVCNKGGINMLDISLKAPWLYHINNSYGPWTYIPKYYLNCLCPYDVLMQMSFQSNSELHCWQIVDLRLLIH